MPTVRGGNGFTQLGRRSSSGEGPGELANTTVPNQLHGVDSFRRSKSTDSPSIIEPEGREVLHIGKALYLHSVNTRFESRPEHILS